MVVIGVSGDRLQHFVLRKLGYGAGGQLLCSQGHAPDIIPGLWACGATTGTRPSDKVGSESQTRVAPTGAWERGEDVLPLQPCSACGFACCFHASESLQV
jgi:hypothetical protein